MEDSALNVAHQHYRRAEAHIRYKRFDDAIECHKKASERLEEAKSLTKVVKALESLQLQQEFHNRQEDIIRLKKVQFETYKKAVENQRQKMIQGLGKLEGTVTNSKDSENAQLQHVIIRTMEEQDSLIEILLKRGTENDVHNAAAPKTVDQGAERRTPEGSAINIEGSKLPKGKQTVIEELHTLNLQLRSFVTQLVTQLEVKTREADDLRRRVHFLETSQAQGTVAESSAPNTHNSLHVITDSTGNSSPFVFSPCSELSPEVIDAHVQRVLPTLAPLDMPNFDYSVFQRQKSDDDI